GGRIANAGASLFTNTTLIGNNGQSPSGANNGNDVSGPVTSAHTLISQTAGAAITNDGGNVFNEDPLLDSAGLKFNGGPTETISLLSGSPAFNQCDNDRCKAPAPTTHGADGQSR